MVLTSIKVCMLWTLDVVEHGVELLIIDVLLHNSRHIDA
jgi:hypothetical protein